MPTALNNRRRWGGYLISGIAVCGLAYFVDWAELAAAFRSADPAPLAFAAVVLLACYLAFALRWRALLSTGDRLPLGPVFAAMMAGYMANLLFPLRPGDVLRAMLVDRQFQYGKLKALTSVGLERVFDLGVLCAFGFVSLAWVPAVFEVRLQEILWTTLVLVAIVVALVSAVLVFGRPAGPAPGAVLLHRIRHGVWRVRSALVALAGNSPRLAARVLLIVALSILGWGCFAAAMVACVSAFSPGMTYGAGLVLMVVTNLGAAIPSSPAGLGVYHALAVMTLVTFGVSSADALAIAIVSHGLAVVIQGALGISALAWGGAGAWRRLQVARDESSANARF